MKYYIVLFGTFLMLASCSSKKEEKQKDPPASDTTMHYAVTTVQKGGVSVALKLPAKLAAYQEVSIFPKVNGYVQSVLVDIGSRVSKGQLLMVLEDPELEQAMLQAKERYERSKADLSIDKENYVRLLEAAKTPGAISPLDVSAARTKVQADSSLSNAEKANWKYQETMLGYLKVYAPFSGVITERNVHPGALVSAAIKDQRMLELKDIAHLRLQIDVPEDIAAHFKDKDTVAFYTSAFPGKRNIGFVSRNSYNVNPQFRTQRMEVDVYNNNYTLSPGMFVEVQLFTKGNPNAMTVPKSAIITSTERKYVTVVRNGKAVKVDVRTGNDNGTKVEVYGDLQPGETIITNPTDDIKEGSTIHI
ncbi:MAG: efflux RND transporter periplasmic adaptor subunit [Bacteroidota bacterium]|jgi:RND family efflux transporter MFP subunit|nr:efflux RND transporter periplasmic adaptor subunit [Bacteroidota bacterium]